MTRGDRSGSRAVLIGTSHYRDLAIRPLPADTCVSAMVDLLTGDLCGWPRKRITALEDIDSPRDAVMELVPQVRDVTDVLLVYYVGHGMRTRDGQLALALTGTSSDPEVLPDSALLYPRLLEVLRGSPAATKLVILDCCHAELGLDADFHFQSGANGLTDIWPIDGLYFVGASSRYEKAKTPLGGRLTHFTHALIDVVGTGIPGKPAELTLRQVFVEARARLLRAKLPQPVDGGVRDAHQFPFARNVAYRATPSGGLPAPGSGLPADEPARRDFPADPLDMPSAPGERPGGLRLPGRRALLLAGLGVTATAAIAVPLSLSAASSSGDKTSGKGAVRTGSGGARPVPTLFATLPQSGVAAAEFSPDGKVLALGNFDATISLWDVAARKRTATFTDFTEQVNLGVNAVAFSPDGALLAGADSKEHSTNPHYDGTISLWDVATRKRAATLTDPGVVTINSVVFSPKGAILASANGNGTISIWSAAAYAKIATLTNAVAGAHTITKEVNSVVFSPDGAILASSNVAGLVELWDGTTYAKIATLAGYETGVGALAFSPDGKVLAGATAGKMVHLWDVVTHKEIAGLTYTDNLEEGDASVVSSLAFTPDGKTLIGGTLAGMVLLWDVATRQIAATLGRFTLAGNSSSSVSVVLSPNGKTLAGVLVGKVNLWTLR
ncbi:caspase family protein [Streptomyces sp. NPDC058000]|uniref:caspase, EACC1-associated type n=1 Tax=Streptomyces sp. NPDC058000 TaxID=3346299 RepID=UPI0036EB359E